MKIFDSHCHLNDRAYDRDIDAVISEARSEGVCAMMVVGITEKTSRRAVEIAESYEGCRASVGIHPHDANQGSKEALSRLKKLAANPKVKAWGETGLDFNRMHSPPEIQEKWFVRQMEAAGELGLPLIFHERDSGGRFLELLRSHAPENCSGVVHCFSGTREEMAQYLEMGYYIGITGILTISKRGAPLRQMAAEIPEDRLLVETDAPYLTPAPEKNTRRRNEPAFVKSVLLKLAEVRNTDPERLAEAIWENTCRLFAV
ncbi:MAG: TatD family hydrolase [Desulfosalsimonas sp.]